jgi:4-aminobutyrate aminotransferase-like enzyme
VLAERLNALAPFRVQPKTIFFTTGAEAAENAVKIARVATILNEGLDKLAQALMQDG